MAQTFELTLLNEKTGTIQKIAVIVPTHSTDCWTVKEAKKSACHILGWDVDDVLIIDAKWEKPEEVREEGEK